MQVCIRVDQVFGAQANAIGGTPMRPIGLARATAKIGMKTRADTRCRLEQRRRLRP
ncbi:hypothetical protein N9W17_00310 [Jannaschia sp.]|nr:hypothetical protein [Jannaschia sp.]